MSGDKSFKENLLIDYWPGLIDVVSILIQVAPDVVYSIQDALLSGEIITTSTAAKWMVAMTLANMPEYERISTLANQTSKKIVYNWVNNLGYDAEKIDREIQDIIRNSVKSSLDMDSWKMGPEFNKIARGFIEKMKKKKMSEELFEDLLKEASDRTDCSADGEEENLEEFIKNAIDKFRNRKSKPNINKSGKIGPDVKDPNHPLNWKYDKGGNPKAGPRVKDPKHPLNWKYEGEINEEGDGGGDGGDATNDSDQPETQTQTSQSVYTGAFAGDKFKKKNGLRGNFLTQGGNKYKIYEDQVFRDLFEELTLKSAPEHTDEHSIQGMVKRLKQGVFLADDPKVGFKNNAHRIKKTLSIAAEELLNNDLKRSGEMLMSVLKNEKENGLTTTMKSILYPVFAFIQETLGDDDDIPTTAKAKNIAQKSSRPTDPDDENTFVPE